MARKKITPAVLQDVMSDVIEQTKKDFETDHTLATSTSQEQLYKILKGLESKGCDLPDRHKEWMKNYEKGRSKNG